MNRDVEILGIKIINIDSEGLISLFKSAIIQNKKLAVTYANANTLNLCYGNIELTNILNTRFTVHPDGIGVYISSGIINYANKLRKRFTGSDFYTDLIKNSAKENWKLYFFGNKMETLEKIAPYNKNLNICGYTEGYNYNITDLTNDINTKSPDILIIGLGQPLQENFIADNIDRINCKVFLAVGDGIKVFAGEKIRGPRFMRTIGLEWTVRFFLHPVKYWKRYIIGNPLFLYRIINSKLSKFKG